MSSKKRRPAIGENPLDALIPMPTEEAPARDEQESVPEKLGAKVRATFHLSTETVEEARDVVISLAGPPLRLTLASLVENAIRSEIERLKRAHNEGHPFPKYGEKLRGGRPIRT